jgi:hypothetical protein
MNEVLGKQTIGHSTIARPLRLARFKDMPVGAAVTKHPCVVDRAISQMSL